jgi:hypothetical protein
LLLLLLFFSKLYSAIAVLAINEHPDADLQKRTNFSTLMVGLSGTGDQTQATCVACSGDRLSAIHYDQGRVDYAISQWIFNENFRNFLCKPSLNLSALCINAPRNTKIDESRPRGENVFFLHIEQDVEASEPDNGRAAGERRK